MQPDYECEWALDRAIYERGSSYTAGTGLSCWQDPPGYCNICLLCSMEKKSWCPTQQYLVFLSKMHVRNYLGLAFTVELVRVTRLWSLVVRGKKLFGLLIFSLKWRIYEFCHLLHFLLYGHDNITIFPNSYLKSWLKSFRDSVLIIHILLYLKKPTIPV